MGDLSKNFSRLEVQCPCGCGADKISSVLIEKLQKVRNIIGTPILITSGVRCEFYNASIKASMNSSHSPTLTSKNPHLFDLSCLHCAYITKIGYETNLITRSE